MSMVGKQRDPGLTRNHIGRYMLVGFVIVVLFLGGLVAWSMTTQIAGAVVTQGSVVVESNVKKVQHPTGGVVEKIFVREGDDVKANQLLIRLDETVTRANLQVITKQLDELAMRAARLAAERDDSQRISVPGELKGRIEDFNVARIVNGEKSLFESRRETKKKQVGQLRERVAQLEKEAVGIQAQIAAKTKEIDLIAKELDGLKELEEMRLVTTNRMTALRREAARLEGERGQLVATAAQTKGKISEVELNILAIKQQYQTQVVDELRQVESKQSSLEEKRIAAEDQLKRVEIRAPRDGKVLQLSAHTVGGVLNAGDSVMRIVPNDDRLMVEARIAPRDIDQLHLGQPAVVRFAAFNQRTTPELHGEVTGISADLSRDATTGEEYFLARIILSDQELARLGKGKIIPGMPADVQIRTDDRTALSFLVKPLRDQLQKAFREQ
jgi:membrane fusion protein, type I secretion system